MDRSRASLWPGRPYPLGATWDGAGVSFALFSEHATGVELGVTGSSGGELDHLIHVDRTEHFRRPSGSCDAMVAG